MMLETISSIAASRAQSSVSEPAALKGVNPSAETSTDFAEVLGRLTSDAVQTLQSGETAAIQGLKGETSPLAVVGAVMDAQRTLHTALSIRDKIVSAYQEISRMTI